MSQPSNLMEKRNTFVRFTGGGGLTGYPCPKCGQYVGNMQVHECFNWHTCVRCGARVGNMQVHYCPVIPSTPWTPNPVVPITPPSHGYFCSKCGAFVVDGTNHSCIQPEPQPLRPGTKQPFTCPRCNGEKKVNGKPCKPCNGTGIVWG